MDGGRGRLGKRAIRLAQALTKGQAFRGLKQGFELTRGRAEKGKAAVGVGYGVTSLSRERAGAVRLPGLARGHRGAEINQSEDPSSAGLCAA